LRIGVVGAGALGLTFAAGLSAAHEVVVLTRRDDAAEVLARDGIAVEDARGTARVAQIAASTEPGALAACDAVLVAVKAYATADALAPLRGVLDARTLIATLQNGLGNAARIHAALPAARVVVGVTNQGAIRLGDARVRAVNRGTTTFARRPAGEHPDTGTVEDAAASGATPDLGTPETVALDGDDLAAAWRAADLDAEAVDDIAPLVWRKLVANAAINPLGALAARPNGAILDDPDLAALARLLAAEAASVAGSAGIALGDPWEAVEAAARPTAANRNSMLQDLEAGRPTEIDAIAGAIVRRAAESGIAVPLTETMLRLVRARERG
jgi:2-dehydropantoate 2-reductase